jgi:hypothetical protein
MISAVFGVDLDAMPLAVFEVMWRVVADAVLVA